MSEKQRLQLENELLMTCSKAQAINKYIDELEESSKLSELWCKSQQENQSLKKQLEEYKQEKQEWINLLNMFKNQQKKFISYLDNCINELKKESMNELQNTINLGIVNITKEILSKYQEIIGHQDG